MGRQRGTRTSPVVSFDSLLSFLSTTSTFVLVALFSSRVLEYQWATTVFELFYFKCVTSSLEELMTIKTIFILRQGMFR